MLFAIVQFIDEEDLPFAVVPQVWLSEAICFWPPFTLRKKDKGSNLAIRCTPPHSTWEKHNFKFMKGAESWQEAMRYLERFQTGSSVETTADDKKRKRKRTLNSKYRPQASSDEEESSLPDAPAVLSFEKIITSNGNEFSVLPDAPEVSFILENQKNVQPSVDFRAEQGFSPVVQSPLLRANSLSTRESHHSVIGPWTPLKSRVQNQVFSYEDVQRFKTENQALREENQAMREENQALREENQARRESNARAASDDSNSLQEQVKQVGTMFKTFARTGQSGADQTLILRRLGEFGDVVRSMDNKMDTMLQHFSTNVSVGDLSLPATRPLC